MVSTLGYAALEDKILDIWFRSKRHLRFRCIIYFVYEARRVSEDQRVLRLIETRKDRRMIYGFLDSLAVGTVEENSRTNPVAEAPFPFSVHHP